MFCENNLHKQIQTTDWNWVFSHRMGIPGCEKATPFFIFQIKLDFFSALPNGPIVTVVQNRSHVSHNINNNGRQPQYLSPSAPNAVWETRRSWLKMTSKTAQYQSIAGLGVRVSPNPLDYPVQTVCSFLIFFVRFCCNLMPQPVWRALTQTFHIRSFCIFMSLSCSPAFTVIFFLACSTKFESPTLNREPQLWHKTENETTPQHQLATSK